MQYKQIKSSLPPLLLNLRLVSYQKSNSAYFSKFFNLGLFHISIFHSKSIDHLFWFVSSYYKSGPWSRKHITLWPCFQCCFWQWEEQYLDNLHWPQYKNFSFCVSSFRHAGEEQKMKTSKNWSSSSMSLSLGIHSSGFNWL